VHPVVWLARHAGISMLMLYTVLIVLAIIALAMFILGRR
jgi:hypothetical protein